MPHGKDPPKSLPTNDVDGGRFRKNNASTAAAPAGNAAAQRGVIRVPHGKDPPKSLPTTDVDGGRLELDDAAPKAASALPKPPANFQESERGGADVVLKAVSAVCAPFALSTL